MKKILASLLAAAMLFSAAGCQSISCEDAPTQANGETHTEFPGVEVRVAGVYTEDGITYLDVVWSNETACEVTYGEPYSIERLDGDQWVSCAKQAETVFICIGYLLKAGSQITKSYAVSELFDISTPGTYRFKTSCSVYAGGENSQNCALWASFTVASSDKTEKTVAFQARYVQCHGYEEVSVYPRVEIIRSAEELRSYYESYEGSYDEAYFETGYLICILIGEGSGSIRHRVTKTAMDADGKLSVYIHRIVPEVCTCDMVQWQVILELSKETEIASENHVQVCWDDSLTTASTPVTTFKPQLVLPRPPEGTLITPNGETPLTLGGYSWTCKKADGTMEAVIADQAYRILPAESLETATVSKQNAETVYAYDAATGKCEEIDLLGYPVKLSWDTMPDAITYTCWPEAVWENAEIPEETVFSFGDAAFYAKPGGYIYEIVATWDDADTGYYGTANYYAYITDGQ